MDNLFKRIFKVKGDKRRVGRQKERFACKYLQKEGLHLIQANYYCRLGEIDLIMEDQDSLVFVEVRYREADDFGTAIESITPAKQKRIIRAAQHYLQSLSEFEEHYCRFDVIGLSGSKSEQEVTWIKNAFGVKSIND